VRETPAQSPGTAPAAVPGGVVHHCPHDGMLVTPCCGRTPFDLPRTDRVTVDPSLVTCFIARLPPPVAEAEPWTDEQLGQFVDEWRRQARKPGRIRLLTPLPRRVRVRLAAARAVDRVAIRLVDRKRYRAARALWRAFGMWNP
jgi:hypothetical protein